VDHLTIFRKKKFLKMWPVKMNGTKAITKSMPASKTKAR